MPKIVHIGLRSNSVQTSQSCYAKIQNSNETFLSNFQTGRKVGASRFQLQLTRKAGKSGKKEEANGN